MEMCEGKEEKKTYTIKVSAFPYGVLFSTIDIDGD